MQILTCTHANAQIDVYTLHQQSASISCATVGTGEQGWNCAAAAAADDDGWEGRSPICKAKAEIRCPDTSCLQPSNSGAQ